MVLPLCFHHGGTYLAEAHAVTPAGTGEGEPLWYPFTVLLLRVDHVRVLPRRQLL